MISKGEASPKRGPERKRTERMANNPNSQLHGANPSLYTRGHRHHPPRASTPPPSTSSPPPATTHLIYSVSCSSTSIPVPSKTRMQSSVHPALPHQGHPHLTTTNPPNQTSIPYSTSQTVSTSIPILPRGSPPPPRNRGGGGRGEGHSFGGSSLRHGHGLGARMGR